MNKFKVGDIVKFIGDDYADKDLRRGTFTVEVTEVNAKVFGGKVVESTHKERIKGEVERYFAFRYFELTKPKPFRDLRGRFAVRKKFRLYLREIRVVPVEIEAANLEDAEALVFQGDGEYQNEKSFHSDLSASDYFRSIFEQAAEEIEK